MNTLKLKDVTIVYNEKQVNKELCKQVHKKIMSVMFIYSLSLALALYNLSIVLDRFIRIKGLSTEAYYVIFCIAFIALLFIIGTNHFRSTIYEQQIKAFEFMDYAFDIDSITAGWFDGNILLKINNHSRIIGKDINSFIKSIKNEHIIHDNSDRNSTIHITIDITDNDKTLVLIDNI